MHWHIIHIWFKSENTIQCAEKAVCTLLKITDPLPYVLRICKLTYTFRCKMLQRHFWWDNLLVAMLKVFVLKALLLKHEENTSHGELTGNTYPSKRIKFRSGWWSKCWRGRKRVNSKPSFLCLSSSIFVFDPTETQKLGLSHIQNSFCLQKSYYLLASLFILDWTNLFYSKELCCL